MANAPSKPRVAKPATPRQKVEKIGPSLAKLRSLAKASRPPQSWYDENDNPFKSPRKKK